ncbi:MAG TPA: DUF3568 family protein [Longimicrobiales bacterium]
MLIRFTRSVLLLALVAGIAACAAAAVGAGAGAATGIYLTTRGASTLVQGSVPQVTRRTERVFADLGIRITEREIEEDDSEVELEGETDDLDVTAKIKRESPTTSRVDVEARRSLVEWDQDYARHVLERIVAAGR